MECCFVFVNSDVLKHKLNTWEFFSRIGLFIFLFKRCLLHCQYILFIICHWYDLCIRKNLSTIKKWLFKHNKNCLQKWLHFENETETTYSEIKQTSDGIFLRKAEFKGIWDSCWCGSWKKIRGCLRLCFFYFSS